MLPRGPVPPTQGNGLDFRRNSKRGEMPLVPMGTVDVTTDSLRSCIVKMRSYGGRSPVQPPGGRRGVITRVPVGIAEGLARDLSHPTRTRSPRRWDLSKAAGAVTGGDAEGGPVAPGADQGSEIAPESKQKCSPRFLGFDPQGGLQLIGGLVIGLIALYSSYDHINLFGAALSLNQQRGVCFIIASLVVVAVVAEGFCAAVAQLASRSRLRAKNEAAENRDRRREETRARIRAANEAARREVAQLLRARVEAEARQAQLAYSVDPSTILRAQLVQALIKLRSTAVLPASGVLSPMNGQDQDLIAILPEVDGIGKLPHHEPSHHTMHTWK